MIALLNFGCRLFPFSPFSLVMNLVLGVDPFIIAGYIY